MSRRVKDCEFDKLNDEEAIKIGSLNCFNIKTHWKDIEADVKLLTADIVNLQETWLYANEEDFVQLESHYSIFNSDGNGKGVATLSKDLICDEKRVKEHGLYIISVEFKTIRIINVYRSIMGSDILLLEFIRDTLRSEERSIIVTGDLNICFNKAPKQRFFKGMKELGFQQLVTEPTHVKGGTIDHIYWLDRRCEWEDPNIERYSPYYSDHDALLVTLRRR